MVKLYTTHCPKCKILAIKLDQKNIEYTECSDEQEMISKNILSVPVLEVDGKLYDFSSAISWVNGR